MASDEIRQVRVSAAPPPRTLNVQKFAESRTSEIESLHSIVANRLNNDFRSQRNKRRRTTGYDNRVSKRRYRKRQKVGDVGVRKDDTLEKETMKIPRRTRRKIELKKNPESGFCTSGDGTKRLRTHVWHAKRFTMTKLWGFHLPLGLQGRGRGSRAIMKCLMHGSIVHDASYTCAVQLEGPQEMLLSTLSTVLMPSPSAHSEDLSCQLLSGVIYESAMLHHVGEPFSAIAPVTYMWRPLPQQHGGCVAKGHNNNECDDIQKIDVPSPFRQVWVWIHAAGFREGYDVLKSACQRQVNDDGTMINCTSLEGHLGKLELIGSKASQVLQKILRPVSRLSGNSWGLNKCSVAEADAETQLKNSSLFGNEDQISSSVFSLTVNDPRVLTGKDGIFVQSSTGHVGHVEEDEVDGHKKSAGIPDSSIELLLSPRSKIEEKSQISDCIDLWDASKAICPPVEENVLCMEKHHQRMAFCCLTDKGSRELNASLKGQCSTLCPILLLRNNTPDKSIVRWSIVLPLNWVRAFWVPLVSSGARAIGLREKRWIACEVGLPYFPSDFPGCNAYSCFMATEAAAIDHNAELRPPCKRPLRVPIPPPWDIIRYSFGKNPTSVGDNQIFPKTLCSENMINNKFTESSSCEYCHAEPLYSNGVSFEGLVARTSYLLMQFLNSINANHLLLFPKIPDRKNCISKFMKDKEMLIQDPKEIVSQVNCDHNLCFLRIFLHAFKEGFFEEGAVVCAPHLSDIALWTSRSDSSKVELQISQTSLRSYFVQEPSGNWKLQESEDPAFRESYRRPIGFVTTGFVYGSKKPVAGALCDAVLLSRLREEQWNSVPVKRRRKEIYVLVRNLQSTAYRLALANIVLEHQEDDVEYM